MDCAKWKTVLWSDESKFEVLFGKLGRHVIRTKEDKDNPSCYQRSVEKPASLMVWGCMSVCGMGSLHIWKGTINAESFQICFKFVFIRCKIYNNRLASVSMYGPNETDSAFLTQIF